MSIGASSGNISSSTWQRNKGNGASNEVLLKIQASHIHINNALFEESDFTLLGISSNSSATISKSYFKFNEAKLILLYTPLPVTESLSLNRPTAETARKPLIVLSCTFQGNTARRTSLISGTISAMKFTDSVFINNTAQMESSIVDLTSTFISFENCEVVNNHGRKSIGFIYLKLCSVFINNCLFAHNSATNTAGVIYMRFNNSLIIQNTVFENNFCGMYGGAIEAIQLNYILLINSTFTENRSFGSNGGAIFLSNRNKMVSKNCTFRNNMAALEGGAIMITDSSSYRDVGSWFFNNSASNQGNDHSFIAHHVMTTFGT